jgi:hypothetical protein
VEAMFPAPSSGCQHWCAGKVYLFVLHLVLAQGTNMMETTESCLIPKASAELSAERPYVHRENKRVSSFSMFDMCLKWEAFVKVELVKVMPCDW